MDNYHINYLH